MRAIIITCVLLAAGCTDLPDFGDGCGNHVLDPGEDCDGDAACDATCHLTCDASAADACPPGFACGADALCHAPSGQFKEATLIPFQDQSVYALTDVNVDGYDDIVSVTPTSLDTDFGGANAAVSDHSSTLIPHPLGVPTFADLDGDAATDVLVPTANGIAGYTSKYKVMSPQAFPIDLAQDQGCPANTALPQPFHVFALDDKYLGLLVILPQGLMAPRMGFAVIDATGKRACTSQAVVPVCNIHPSPDATGNIGVLADVHDTADGHKVVAVTFPGAGPDSGTCVFETTRGSAGKFTVNDMTPTALDIRTRAVLAALQTTTPCPQLLYGTSVGGIGIHKRKASGALGSCALLAEDPLDPQLSLPPTTPDGSVPIGHLRLRPAPSGGTYPADAALLSFTAVTYDATTAVHEVFHSDRPLDQVETADLDGDGDLDAVAYKQGEDGLDLLFRTGDSFLPVRMETGPVVDIELGDFDGNQAGDIAYVEVETDEADSTVHQELLVAYGTRDRPLSPLAVGTLDRVVGLCRIQALDPTDPESLVDDLMLMDLPPETGRHEPLITVFKASPQRSLTAFLDPRTQQLSDDAFAGVVAGNFFTAPAGATDLIGIETTGSAAAPWQFRGTMPGSVEFPNTPPSSSPARSGLAACARALPIAGPLPLASGFCVDNARYIAWPSSAGHDVVLAISSPQANTATGPSGRQVATLDPVSFDNTATMNGVAVASADGSALASVDGSLIARPLRRANVDGEAGDELIAAFVPSSLADVLAKPVVMICTVSGGGVPTKCTSLVDLAPELAGGFCLDAAPISAQPRGRGELDTPPADGSTNLIAACVMDGRSQLWRVVHGGGGYHAIHVLDSSHGAITKVEVGDFNGDKVEDVVATVAGGGFPNLVVMPQCPSGDLVDGACR